ncbi:MAG: DsbC family protein [bacterium]
MKTINAIHISLFAVCVGLSQAYAANLQETPIPDLYENTAANSYQDKAGRYTLTGTLLDLGSNKKPLGEDLPVGQVADNIEKRLQIRPTFVEKTPLRGIYIAVFGDLVKYMDGSGRFLFRDGKLLDDKAQDFSQSVLAAAQKAQHQQHLTHIKTLSNQDKVIYQADNERHAITIFTDLDCPFCRKLHNDIPNYLAQGISVHYVMYPRDGAGSKGYQKAVNVWCQTDQQTAIEQAFADMMRSPSTTPETHANTSCQHPIDKHLSVAENLRLVGTPVIMSPEGRLLHGYHSVDEVIAVLSTDKTATVAQK